MKFIVFGTLDHQETNHADPLAENQWTEILGLQTVETLADGGFGVRLSILTLRDT